MTLHFETTPLLNGNTSMSSAVNMAGQPMKKYGKLVLVDLAGSERLKVQLCLSLLHSPWCIPTSRYAMGMAHTRVLG